MTNQVNGEILFQGVKNGVYTPWMPVRGDRATFAIEVMQKTSAITLTWRVETRKREEEPGSPIYVTASASVTGGSTGVFTEVSTGDALELVRYWFTTPGTANATDYVVFRALNPSWQIDR